MSHLLVPSIPGAEQLVEWFGRWPSFHDAEILELSLRHTGNSCLRVHTWRMTGQADSGGVMLDQHAIVTFSFERIVDLELYDFSVQNVISRLDCEPWGNGFRLTMSPCWGIQGHIDMEQLAVSFELGNPKENP